MLLFFLCIAEHILHKSQSVARAVHLVLSLATSYPYAQNLPHSSQKLRGASFLSCKICERNTQWSKFLTLLKRRLPTLTMINHSIIDPRELNCSVKQRTVVAGESSGGLHTLPNRHRLKPRIDCVAILGKLSSLIVISSATIEQTERRVHFEMYYAEV